MKKIDSLSFQEGPTSGKLITGLTRCWSSARHFVLLVSLMCIATFSMGQQASNQYGLEAVSNETQEPLIIYVDEAYNGSVENQLDLLPSKFLNSSLAKDHEPEPTIEFCPETQTVECFTDIESQPLLLEYTIYTPGNAVIFVYNPAVLCGVGSCPGAGYTITYVVMDQNGNTAECVQEFYTVNDAPEITFCPDGGEITSPDQAIASPELVQFTYSCPEDPFCGDIGVEVTGPVVGDDACLGTTFTFTYSVTDGCGRTATCEQVFNMAPEDLMISCADSETVECVADIDASADDVTVSGLIDGIDYEVTVGDAVLTSGDEGCDGAVYTVSYTVTDDCERTATCTRTYTIENDGPTIMAPEDMTVECIGDIIGDEEAVLVTTSCLSDFEVTVGEPVLTDGDGNCDGIYTITYTATDDCGRTATDVQTFTIDNDGPTIMAPADMTVECAADIMADIEGVMVTTSCEAGYEVTAGEMTLVDGEGNCDGVYTITYTATDDCGRTATATQTFTIDNDGPTITAPEDMTVECFEDVIGDETAVIVTTSCLSDFEVTVGEPVLMDGDGECEGMYTITYTATDDCGRTATDVQTFTIDNDGPTIVAPEDMTVECASDVMADIEGVVVTTSCDAGFEVTAGDMVQVDGDECEGTYTITYTATDDCGRTSTATQTFTIDNDGPTIMAPADMTVECAADIMADIEGVMVTTSCEAGYEVTAGEMTLVDGEGNCDGVYTITYTATDDCGRTATATQTFTIDNDGPTITAPEDMTVECFEDVIGDETAVIVTTSCLSDFEVTVGEPVLMDGDGECEGMYTITYTATDDCGRTATDVQTFTIDNDGPTIVAPEDMTVECASDVMADIEGVVVTTSCDAGFEVTAGDMVQVDGDECEGTYTITYTATDDCGRTSTATQTFTIDNDGPTIMAPADMTVECAADIMADIEGVMVTTSCEAGYEVTAGEMTLVDGEGNCDGVYTITYTATDDCGRTATATQTFTIDNDGPTITAPEDMTVECFEDVIGDETAVIVTTSCLSDFEVTVGEPVLMDGDGECEGMYTITYTATDDCGRTATDVQTFTIDNDGPTIVAPEDMTVECASDVMADIEGVVVTTSCDAGFEVTAGDMVQVDGDECEGTYTITYTATDDCGRTSTATQTFTIDNDGPTIMAPADMTVECAADIMADIEGVMVTTSCEAGYEVTAGEMTLVDGEGNCDGVYTITYTATDDCGRTATATQTFTIDNDGPTITAPEDMTVECFEDVIGDETAVIVTTSCLSDFEVTVGEPVLMDGDGECEGMYTITYTATDDCGRTATDVQTFTIDNDGPTIVAPEDMTVECASDVMADIEGVVVTTSCDAGFEVTAGDMVQVDGDECEGTYTITYTATDDCGRTSTATQTFTIDNDGPTIMAPEDMTVDCIEDVIGDMDAAIVTTSCESDYEITLGEPVLVDGVGGECEGATYSIMYTVTDECGRTSNDTQVFVVTNEGPVITSCPADMTVSCYDDIAPMPLDLEYTFSGCSDVFIEITPVGFECCGEGNCPGTQYSITYTITDECGRTDSCVQIFTIDNEGPVITSCPEGGEIASADELDDMVFSAEDIEYTVSCGMGADVVISGPVTTVNDNECESLSYTYTYTVTDSCGRVATCERTFSVECEDGGGPDLGGDEPCFASQWLEYNPGGTSSGNPIAPIRMNPEEALGAPELDDTYNFVSLGFGGSLVVGFNEVAINGDGPDIRVYETTFNNEDCESYQETAEVFVSQNGVDFISVGTTCTNEGGEFDISDANPAWEYITMVRVVDISPLGDTPSEDAYDVDAVGVIHGCAPLADFFDIEGGCTASEVIAYTMGTEEDGTMIPENRTNPENALGTPEDDQSINFVTLGYGGSVTLGFDGQVLNGEGDDLQIIETSFGNPSCETYSEYADVEVSQDGSTFYYVGTVCLDNAVDISDAGVELDYIVYVRITNNDELSTSSDGYDVDGVYAIHNCEEGEIPSNDNIADGESNFMTVGAENNIVLKGYPNPTEGETVVSFNVPTTTFTTLEVFDMEGRNVATLFSQEAAAGNDYRVDFNGSDLPNGIYIYRLSTENTSVIEKFILAK